MEGNVEEIIRKWLLEDKIAPGRRDSPWNNPVFAKKTGAKTKLIGDFRKLNSTTNGSRHPIPSIMQLLERLSGKKFFSRLDLSESFLQVPVKDRDRHKLSFTVGHRRFHFNRCPLGVSFMSSVMQQCLDQVVGDLDGVSVYVDDIVIASGSYEVL